MRPARHLVTLIWLARNRQETDLASADIALALAADAADGGAINPEDASDIGIAGGAISMPFARPTSGEGSCHGSAAIPNLAAGPPKKAPINQWEHRYLGEERFPKRLSALEIELLHP